MYPDQKLFEKLCAKTPATFGVNVGAPNTRYLEIKQEYYEKMPVILCEYAHCMENSLGNFKEHCDAFEQYDHLCGGYIWDFVDQAIHTVGEHGEQWLYGSDFSERYDPKNGLKSPFTTGSNRYFCANGNCRGGSHAASGGRGSEEVLPNAPRPRGRFGARRYSKRITRRCSAACRTTA